MSSQQKPNVLLVGNPHSDPSAKAFLIKFLKLLSPLAEEIHVISGDDPRVYSNVCWIKMKKATYKSSPKKVISFLSFQFRLSFNLITKFKKTDVVIFFPYTMIIPIFIAKLKRIKIILHAGGSASKNIIYGEELTGKYLLFGITKILENLSFVLSDKIIIESKSSLEFQNLENYRNKVVMGGLFVDIDLFNCKNAIKKRKNKVSYLGSLYKLKGADKFYKAVILMQDYLNEKDIEVIIGGDGPLFDEIKNELKNNGFYGKVKLIGWIPHNKLPEFLNELKLIVIPSNTEGLPNIVLEAMACGTPVLVTSVGAIPDIIKDGETGFIMDNNSPECIAENVIRALEHSNLERIVENARVLVEQEFTYQAALERYKGILNCEN